ncbi:MAG TPA: SRPBCC family protein [Thermoplasmata archaeon]|nr:SRPBCC family protein [Thermoplasmata archaeon]
MTTRVWSDAVDIRRPMDAVFSYIADPSTGTNWIKGVTKIELLDPPPIHVGSRFLATRQVGKRLTTEQIHVIEHDPPTRFGVGAGLMGGGIELRINYSLTPSAPGVRIESRTQASAKTFGSRLFFGMVWKAVTENDAGNLRTLKTLLERA